MGLNTIINLVGSVVGLLVRALLGLGVGSPEVGCTLLGCRERVGEQVG